MHKWFAMVLAVGLLFSATACQKAAEETAEEAVSRTTGVDVETDEDKVTIEGEGGESVEIQGSGAELPDDFPEDVKVYDGRISGASTMTNNDQRGFYVTVETEDDFSKVADWHKDKYKGEGWTAVNEITSETEQGPSAVLMYKKGDLTLNVAVSENDAGKLEIAYIVNEGQP